MAQDSAIHIEQLGKRYRIGQTIDLKRTFRETLSSVPRHLAGKLLGGARGLAGRLRDAGGSAGGAAAGGDLDTPPGTFWALRDINLDIAHGDVVGLIGPNGAGKSTLLKVLARITSPTRGRAELRGRISSLLEVGTGFHMELTGRENIYLNAAILGMRKTEIDRKFDDIVEFSGVQKFLDTPVKRYSSGMYVRLAFAVAAHLESEIMLVDEILSVGDAEFQRKCLGQMKDMAATGRTVIYVSHNMSSVRTLCRSAIHLENGQLMRYGPVDEVIDGYLRGNERKANEAAWPDLKTAPGNYKARIQAVRVVHPDGRPCRIGDVDSPIVVEIDYTVLEPDTILNLNLLLYNQEDVFIFGAPSSSDEQWFQKPHPVGRYRSRCIIPGKLLNRGYFTINLTFEEKGNFRLARLLRVVGFELIDSAAPDGYHDRWNGIIRPRLDWRTDKIE